MPPQAVLPISVTRRPDGLLVQWDADGHDALFPARARRLAYGLRIRWSDGHSTGIYTFERMLATCPCTRCRLGRGESG